MVCAGSSFRRPSNQMHAPMMSSPSSSVPALHNGDRLKRPEFERRCAAMLDMGKAELIEGTVYMPSPVPASGHGKPHAPLMT